MTTKIFIQDETLVWDGERLATVEEFEQADRCVGSVFEALQPGERIQLAEGVFQLDSDLDIDRQR